MSSYYIPSEENERMNDSELHETKKTIWTIFQVSFVSVQIALSSAIMAVKRSTVMNHQR